MGRAEGGRITVRLAWSPGPGRAEETSLELPAGSTLRDALAAGGLLAPGAAPPARVGIWGRRRSIDAELADGDRVEVWRPLQVEPMDARRARARSQRERAAGKR
jgi:putative ubiquitin-RnfH superfamily antitoxin RatB of RatAB toxin-antitoxin module